MRIGKKQVKGDLIGNLWIKAYDSVLSPKSVATLVSEANMVNEDFADISDWVDQDTNTGISTQVTFDSKSCVKLDSGTGGGAQRARSLGALGNRTVLNWSMYQVAIAGPPSTDEFYSYIFNGTHGVFFRATSTGFYVYDSVAADNVEVGTNLVVQDTWQEWTIDIDWTTQTLDLYLGGVLQASDVPCHYNDTTAEGTFHISTYYRTGNIQSITYVDWFKISKDGYTSVTISGLNGDVDKEYRVLIRAIVGAPSTSIYIRPNNNSTISNYGEQWLRGNNASATGYRQTTGVGFYCHPWSGMATGEYNLSDTLIHAKSGYLRTAITQAMAGSGTTINDISTIGGVWTNTADNITSLVITADTAYGLGIGTSIELWKRVPLNIITGLFYDNSEQYDVALAYNS